MESTVDTSKDPMDDEIACLLATMSTLTPLVDAFSEVAALINSLAKEVFVSFKAAETSPSTFPKSVSAKLDPADASPVAENP